MKTRAKKQEDLKNLTEQFKNSKSAMVLSFNKLTVAKDQEFRNELRETGATYRVVKNTLARLAVEGTPFENAKEHFVGVTSIATTNEEPMDLSKIVAKYVKENKGIFEFKAGVVDGKVVDFNEVQTIADLPSKEELIAKVLYLLNSPAQRLATVLNAVPRDLAIVTKQISERTDNLPGEEPKAEQKEEAKAETEDAKQEEATEEKTEEPKVDEKSEVTEESSEAAEEADKQEETAQDESAETSEEEKDS